MLFQVPYYPRTGGGVWRTLADWGFVDALLPFMLIFILVFAILQRIKLFTDDAENADRRINGILALVLAAIVVAPHIMGMYPRGSDPIIMIMQFLPGAVVILVAVLMVILLLGLAGGEIPNLMLWAVALVALGFLVFTILMAVIPGFFPTFQFLRDPSVQALIIILLVMGLIGFFVIREPTGQRNEFANWIQRWMGPPGP